MIEEKRIELKKFEINRFKVSIKGKADLLMHGKTNEWADWFEEERNKKKSEKKRGTPEEEVARGTYKDDKGNFVVPAKNILRMVRDAYGSMTNFARGYKKEIEHSLNIFPLEIPLKFKSFEIDKRDVNIGQGIPDIRYRNKFSGWDLAFEVFLRISLEFDEKRFFTILKFAGDFVGLCDGRNIGFGRFDIVNK